METHAVRYSSPALAEKIARNYGSTAQKVPVTIFGSSGVSKLIAKIEKAHDKTDTKPTNLD